MGDKPEFVVEKLGIEFIPAKAGMPRFKLVAAQL